MTKAEAEFQQWVRDAGCIICLTFRHVRTPCEIHHILRGGRRIDEWHVLGLCPPDHRGGRCDAEVVSRHPYKRQFELRYGTELELHAMVKALYENGQPA